jgi:CheY-like chemotaxis protein
VKDQLALIVEDNEDAIVIFGEALHVAGFETETIGSGDEALERLARDQVPALVVLDLRLPKVSGMEVLHHIRADARWDETPVVVATAYPRLAERLRDDPDALLIKPIPYSRLCELFGQMRMGRCPDGARL